MKFASKTREANTTWREPNITAKQYNSPQANRTEKSTCICKCFFLELLIRFELMTSSLPMTCSTY